MADTGAPWNIPYVEPTDIPRGYPQDSEDLALAVAAGLSAAGNAGIGANVVQAVKLDAFSTTSTSYTTVTGLSATITPSTATAKVLVIAQVSLAYFSTGNDQGVFLRISGGNAGTYIGDAAGSREQAAAYVTSRAELNGVAFQQTVVFLDSPASASPVTYGVDVKRASASEVRINLSQTDSNNTNFGRTVSSITVIEVAA
jgi:hypothetical protein